MTFSTFFTPKPARDSLTTRVRHALKQLRRRTGIIIKAADKGSGTVIMDRDWYINECLGQFNDTKFYRRLDTDITSDIQTRGEFFIKRLHKDGFIDYKTRQFLIQTTISNLWSTKQHLSSKTLHISSTSLTNLDAYLVTLSLSR